jgi:hypothetical protein
VVRIDPAAGTVLADIPVEGITAKGNAGAPDWSGIASGGGLIWVTAEPAIVGIDPATNEVVRRIGEESGVSRITFADGLIVVGGSAEGNGDIRLIDPVTKEYVGNPGADLRAYPSVLVTSDWYWAGGEPYPGGAALTRVSKDGTADQAIAGVPRFDSFTEAGGFVWVTGGDSLLRVDEAYGGTALSPQSVVPDEVQAVTGTLPVGGPAEVAGDGTALWLLDTSSGGGLRLTELDPGTGGRLGPSVSLEQTGPAELTVLDGEPWVSFRSDGRLVTLVTDHRHPD